MVSWLQNSRCVFRSIRAATIAALLGTSQSSYAGATIGDVETVGVGGKIQGAEMQISRNGRPISVRKGSKIDFGDEITTDHETAIEIKVFDGSQGDLISVAVNSRILLDSDGDSDAIVVRLLSGAVRVLEWGDSEKTIVVVTEEARVITKGEAVTVFREGNRSRIYAEFGKSIKVGPPGPEPVPQEKFFALKRGQRIDLSRPFTPEDAKPRKFSSFNLDANLTHSRSGPWWPVWQPCNVVTPDDRERDLESGSAQ